MDENRAPDVPYIVHEGAMARADRDKKRLWIAVLILISALIICNIGWLVYESAFDTFYYKQDGDGVNNVNVGRQGDVIYEPEG